MTASAAVTRILTKMADSLDGDRPDGEMTEAARIDLICQFIPGHPDLFDEVFPATPEITTLCSRAEYATALRAVQAQTTPRPDDGTPTNDPAAALHWAAASLGLAEARAEQGHPLTDTERVAYDRYQDAAYAHGFTDAQIRDYLNDMLRPQAAQ